MQKRGRILLLLGIVLIFLIAVLTVLAAVYYSICGCGDVVSGPPAAVDTLAGSGSGIGEPFGIAERWGEVYVSDGIKGKIWRISKNGGPVEFAAGLNTPSAIAFDANGDLVVADTGSHTIKKITRSGSISVLAGAEGQAGDVDGSALSARFDGPIGLAVLADGAIAVADTYNDKIKLIRNDIVTTLAGSVRGYGDGFGTTARFDTPCGVAAMGDGSILVADAMNGRIRLISNTANVSTLAGDGDGESRDGTLLESSFYRPYAIASGPDGSLFIGDGSALRVIKNGALPMVQTISKSGRGYADGPLLAARFNRVSGIAVSNDYKIYLADSDNAAVRIISPGAGPKSELPAYAPVNRRTDPAEFRTRQAARWPYDPPTARRDIAGTLGEIRGELTDQNSQVWFHNGLDIAGGYGEKARFIRDETVLNPVSTENFKTLRELIRLPTIGYIHIRLGRDAAGNPLGDGRFRFDPGMTGVRVRRGTFFRAGDVIGTLNSMNHVHMIAGPSGDEMNALDALILPGVTDTVPPVIEETQFFDRNWNPVETTGPEQRITLASDVRIVVRAFDRMDGNPERRRLGVFRLGYQVLNRDRSPLTEVDWNISFDRNPSPDAVNFAYAPGSKSGATGETIFRYIVTNKVDGDSFGEGFFDPMKLPPGEYVLRVVAADYFGNSTSADFIFANRP